MSTSRLRRLCMATSRGFHLRYSTLLYLTLPSHHVDVLYVRIILDSCCVSREETEEKKEKEERKREGS